MKPLLIGAGFVVMAVLWYFVYGRRGYSHTSALMTVVKRLSEPDFGATDLENELLGVLMERDGITQDRFDALVMDAPVIDYLTTVSRDQLFSDVSRILAERWELEEKKLEEKFRGREEQTSTVISSGVAVPHAVPHAIVEGESVFDLVLVRARYGIKWNDSDVVYTAFALIGSKDERNFHLRALMSIAQILQDPTFTAKWNGSRNERELRSAVILATRKRHHS